MTNRYRILSHFPSASSFHVPVMNTSRSHHTSTVSIIVDLEVDVCRGKAEVMMHEVVRARALFLVILSHGDGGGCEES